MQVSNSSLEGLFFSDVVQLECTDVAGVLGELAARVPDISEVEREQLLAALLTREGQMSTGVGDGVALPHSREVHLASVREPRVLFGVHSGLEYDAIDGQPVRLFLLLLAPSIETHLALLARLSRLMRRVAVREALLAVDSREALAVALAQAE